MRQHSRRLPRRRRNSIITHFYPFVNYISLSLEKFIRQLIANFTFVKLKTNNLHQMWNTFFGDIMLNKNRIFQLFFIFLVFVTALYLTLTLILDNRAAASEQRQKSYTPGYTVKEYEGRIAIFENGNEQPLRVLQSPFVRDLPTFDRQLLEEGVIAHNESELIDILEDYDY